MRTRWADSLEQRNKNLNRIRRACTNVEVRRLLLHAIKSGAEYRMTKSGVIIYGSGKGVAVAHFTISDRRGASNLRSQLRRIGVDVSSSK